MYPKNIAQSLPSQFETIISSFSEKHSAWEWKGRDFQEDSKDKINLVTWCEWISKRQNECDKNNTYDPRVGEWTALEIVRQVLKLYQIEVRDISGLKKLINKGWPLIHPANFVMTKDWIADNTKEKLTWHSWNNFVGKRSNLI